MHNIGTLRCEGNSVVVPVCGVIHSRIDDPVVTIPSSPEDERVLTANDIGEVFQKVRDVLEQRGFTELQLRSRPVCVWIEGKGRQLPYTEQQQIMEAITAEMAPKPLAMIEHSEVRDLSIH